MIRGLVLSLLVSASAQAADYNLTTCEKLVSIAERSEKAIQDRWSVGEIQINELNQVLLDSQNTKFDCRAVSFKAYCNSALKLSQGLVDAVKELEKIGQADLTAVLTAEKQNAEVVGRCQ